MHLLHAPFRTGLLTVVFLGLVAGISGCKTKEKERKRTPMELVHSDLAEIRSKSHPGFERFDRQTGGIFSGFFGGSSNADVVNYLEVRLTHFFDPNDVSVGISPSWIFHQDWLTGEQRMNGATEKGETGAANIGMLAWIAGLTANTPVEFHMAGRTFPVESSRTGIMMIGEGYKETALDSYGKPFPLPPEYRQMLLVHEARHSDCTGGISRTELDRLRHGRTSDDLDQSVREIHCGHMHIKCPAGHKFEGIPACDSEPWGAYTAGEIFYRAAREDPNISELDYQIASLVIIDTASRTQVRRSGAPDMSSSGVR